VEVACDSTPLFFNLGS